jgi:hypothetical protein
MHISVTVSKSATVLGFFMALFHSFDIVYAISKVVNDLVVLDVRGVISGIAETLDIIVLDGLEGLGSRRTLIGALKVPDEHSTQLVPGVNGSLG